MENFIRSCFLTVLVFLSAIPLYAQEITDAHLDSLILKLDVAADGHVTPDQAFITPGSSVAKFRSLFQTPRDSSSEIAKQLSVLEAEQAVLKNDYGFDLEAGYLENFKAGLFDIEGIFYRRRATFGLEWNILNNGLVENRYELRALKKQEQLLSDRAKNFRGEDTFENIEQQIDYIFNKKKRHVLQSYFDLIQKQEAVTIALYHQDYVNWDVVLAVTSEKARIQRLLNSTQELETKFESIAGSNTTYSELPVLELDLEKLLNAASKQGKALSSSVNSTVPEYHPLSDISLSASVQYNYYSNAPEDQLTGTTGRREFVSAGVNISVPLPLNIKEKNRLAEARKRQKDVEVNEEVAERKQRIYTLFDHYQQILGEYERDIRSYAMFNEKVRIERTKKRLDDPAYSPRKLVKILENRYSKSLELLSHHRDLYKKLAEIYSVTYHTPVRKYSHPIDITTKDFARPNVSGVKPKYQKSVYIWSATFESSKNGSLVNYLLREEFDTIFLSAGPTPDIGKMKDFIEQAHAAGLSVEWMVGDNTLIDQKHFQKIDDEITTAYNLSADGIHLDVEPQTFDDWEANEEVYKNQYLRMVNYASAWAKSRDLSFSVSVPVYFDSIIGEVSRQVNSVQLMAYGSSDMEQVKARINQDLNAAADNIAIALRPNDFRNYDAMVSFMEKMQDKLPVRRFSIHDLKALLKTTQNNVNTIE